MSNHLTPRIVPAPTFATAARAVAMPARLTWRDQTGATRVASVMTREVTDESVFVECEQRTTIPLYRLVHLQIEQGSTTGLDRLPAPLRDGRVLSAVWHVAPTRPSTGTPGGYRLRFLVDPGRGSAAHPQAAARVTPLMAFAN